MGKHSIQGVNIGSIWNVLRWARRDVVGLALASVVGTGAASLSGVLVAMIVDRGLIPHNMRALVVIASVVIALTAVSSTLQIAQTWLSARPVRSVPGVSQESAA